MKSYLQTNCRFEFSDVELVRVELFCFWTLRFLFQGEANPHETFHRQKHKHNTHCQSTGLADRSGNGAINIIKSGKKRKRKSLFNGEDVANLLMNEFSDDEHYYESSGNEYELPKRKKKGRKKGARCSSRESETDDDDKSDSDTSNEDSQSVKKKKKMNFVALKSVTAKGKGNGKNSKGKGKGKKSKNTSTLSRIC